MRQRILLSSRFSVSQVVFLTPDNKHDSLRADLASSRPSTILHRSKNGSHQSPDPHTRIFFNSTQTLHFIDRFSFGCCIFRIVSLYRSEPGKLCRGRRSASSSWSESQHHRVS